MERDFIGYGRTPPKAAWPGGARVAVSIVVNYEEGSENSLAFGDPVQEGYKEYPKPMPDGVRDLTNEQVYEFGSRVGVWRVLRELERQQVKVTVFGCAMALERNPDAARALADAGHEICSHGWRWQEQFRMTEDEERAFIARAVESLARTTGQRPLGWYCRYGPSVNTRRLLIEEGGFEYDSDNVADELPFYDTAHGAPHLVVPYTIDCNDMKFWTTGAYGHAGDFFAYLRDSFDTLYEEGAETPRMMSVGLHLRVIGRPGRFMALRRFLDHVRAHEGVWIARRIDIARWWREHHPPAEA